MCDMKTIEEVGKNLSAAFAGALFAYLFMQVSDDRKRRHERKIKHLKALSRLSFMANEHVDAIGNSIYGIDHFVKAFEKAKSQDRMVVTPNHPTPLQCSSEVLQDLMNVDLVNEGFSYYCSVQRANTDISNLARLYHLFLSAALAGNIQTKVYMENCEAIVNGLREVRKFLENQRHKATRLFAATRIRQRKDSSLVRRLFCLAPPLHNERDFEELLRRELEEVEKEIAQVRETSKEEIRQISSN